MAQEYTKEDLKNSNRIYSTRLRTKVLEEFYKENLTKKAYIYALSNDEIIHLIFDVDQFCHLIGFSYFGYSGISGWNSLSNKNILISNLKDIAKHKREEIRITNFPKILNILDNPAVYLYKNTNMNYKSDYFAVWNDGIRYYKLGIGTGSSGVNYGETYQVSLMNSKDNVEIDPAKLLTITNKFVMPKETFKNLYYPIHIREKRQRDEIENLEHKVKQLQKLQWETVVNSETN